MHALSLLRRPPGPADPRRPAARAALLGLAALGLAYRLAGLGQRSLWLDELLEWERARLPWLQALLGRGIDQDPPLYALFLHVWSQVGPAASEAWLRLPSALAGALAVWLFGRWAWWLFGPAVGAGTALFMALAPVHVHYARELNQYALLTALSGALLLVWERVRTRGGAADWAALSALTALGLGSHYGLAFPLAIVGLDLVWRAVVERRGGATARQAYAGLAAWLLLSALLVAGLLWLGLAERLDIGHVQKRFGGTHPAKELAHVTDVGWRHILVFYLLPFAGGWALPLVRLMALAALAGAADLWRRTPAGPRVVGGLLGGTLLLSYLTDLFGLYPLGYRYGLYAAPLLLICLATGLTWLSRALPGRAGPSAALAGAAVVCASFLAFSPLEPWSWDNPHLSVPREEMRPLLDALETGAGAAEPWYVYHGAGPAFRFYGPARAGDVAWGAPFDSRNAGAARAEAARVRAAAGAGGAVWLLLSHAHPAESEALRTALREAGWREDAAARLAAPGARAERWTAGP